MLILEVTWSKGLNNQRNLKTTNIRTPVQKLTFCVINVEKKSPTKTTTYGRTCGKCHRPKHFASMCHSKLQGVPEISTNKNDVLQILTSQQHHIRKKHNDIQLDTSEAKIISDNNSTKSILSTLHNFS